MTTGFGFFTPYVEAPVVPPIDLAPEASGSDTTAIDHLRQGVEISTDLQRYIGTLPKLGTGDADHQLDITVFGQSSEFTVDSYFGEAARFDPATYIRDPLAHAFPVVLDNPSYEDPERMGGFMQPLAIKARDSLVSTTEFEPHDIRVHLMDGNISSFGDTSQIVWFYDTLESPLSRSLFVDAADHFGFGSGSVSVMGFYSTSEKLIRPFNESRYISRSVVSGSLTGSAAYGIIGAISSMSADSSEYVPNGFRASGLGFTYENSTFGTDSIAFGGLLKR